MGTLLIRNATTQVAGIDHIENALNSVHKTVMVPYLNHLLWGEKQIYLFKSFE